MCAEILTDGIAAAGFPVGAIAYAESVEDAQYDTDAAGSEGGDADDYDDDGADDYDDDGADDYNDGDADDYDDGGDDDYDVPDTGDYDVPEPDDSEDSYDGGSGDDGDDHADDYDDAYTPDPSYPEDHDDTYGDTADGASDDMTDGAFDDPSEPGSGSDDASTDGGASFNPYVFSMDESGENATVVLQPELMLVSPDEDTPAEPEVAGSVSETASNEILSAAPTYSSPELIALSYDNTNTTALTTTFKNDDHSSAAKYEIKVYTSASIPSSQENTTFSSTPVCRLLSEEIDALCIDEWADCLELSLYLDMYDSYSLMAPGDMIFVTLAAIYPGSEGGQDQVVEGAAPISIIIGSDDPASYDTTDPILTIQNLAIEQTTANKTEIRFKVYWDTQPSVNNETACLFETECLLNNTFTLDNRSTPMMVNGTTVSVDLIIHILQKDEQQIVNDKATGVQDQDLISVRVKPIANIPQGSVSASNAIANATAVVFLRSAVMDLSSENAAVTVTPKETAYTGKAIQPNVTVTYNGLELRQGVDYDVVYSDNIKAGTATAKIVGKGNFTGTATAKFKINKAVKGIISGKNFTKTASVKTRTFSLGVRTIDSASKLTYKSSNKNVKVSKAGNVTIPAKFIGSVTITVTSSATANCAKSTRKFTVKVNPAPVSLGQISKTSSSMTVTWKRSKITTITGYQVRISTTPDFSSGNRSVKVEGAKKKGVRIKNLKKGKTYYVKVRTYKTSGKKTYYSSWSTAKSVTIGK